MYIPFICYCKKHMSLTGAVVGHTNGQPFHCSLWLQDGAIPQKSTRDEWVEVCNQVLNALFVLMCLIWHPVFVRQTYQLYRWNEKDIRQLRKEYCKGGHRKPHEWFHISVCNFWFHLTCFGTYALAIVYWVYPRHGRPTVAVAITTVVSFVSPVLAFLWNILSPLGKDFHEIDELEDMENGGVDGAGKPGLERMTTKRLVERSVTFMSSHQPVEHPEWEGRVCPDCCLQPRLACLTTCLPFCVFGYNMERLGFGERWVQTITFMLIIAGPCLVFELSAHTVKNNLALERSIVAVGFALAVIGLLYGAYWRGQMRKRFHLPGWRLCCCPAGFTDSLLWLLCPLCSLCQEVRTAEHYDVGDSTLYAKMPLGEGIVKPGGEKFAENVVGSVMGQMGNSVLGALRVPEESRMMDRVPGPEILDKVPGSDMLGRLGRSSGTKSSADASAHGTDAKAVQTAAPDVIRMEMAHMP